MYSSRVGISVAVVTEEFLEFQAYGHTMEAHHTVLGEEMYLVCVTSRPFMHMILGARVHPLLAGPF